MNTSYNQTEDRRNFERKMFYSKAYLSLPHQKPILTYTSDISRDGICVTAPENLKPHSLCKIRFSLLMNTNVKRFVEVEARIISSIYRSGDDFRISLQFVNPSASVNSTISEFLDRQ